MHTVKEADMLAVKIDLLMKWIENYENVSTQETVQAMDACMIDLRSLLRSWTFGRFLLRDP